MSFGKIQFYLPASEAVDMNGRFQMQGGKNWFLPKEMNANRFFWDSHWLEIWSNHFYPSMGPNGGSVAMDSEISRSCHTASCRLSLLTNSALVYESNCEGMEGGEEVVGSQ